MPLSPDNTPDPNVTPTSWHFPQLLVRVRAHRGISMEEASAALPGVSLRCYEAWEHGVKTPPSWIQTMVVWRLNTASREVFSQTKADQRRKGLFVPSASFSLLIITAISVTLLWKRKEHQQMRIDPVILASEISESAILHGRDSACPQDYMDYAIGLSHTIGKFTLAEWEEIVGHHEEDY